MSSGTAAGQAGAERGAHSGWSTVGRLRAGDDQPPVGGDHGALFAFRQVRHPDAVSPVPKGRKARWVAAGERNGLLAHLVRPKHRSALRLRQPRPLPRALERAETTRLLGSLRTWRDWAIAGLMLFCGLRSGGVMH